MAFRHGALCITEVLPGWRPAVRSGGEAPAIAALVALSEASAPDRTQNLGGEAIASRVCGAGADDFGTKLIYDRPCSWSFDPIQPTPQPGEVRTMSALEQLERRLHRLESVAAIERLQNIYGYYLDNRMWSEIVALFTDDGEAEVGRRGVYRGREQLRTFFFEVLGGGRSGRTRNELHNHIQLQPVVTLSEDAEQAFGRFRALAQFAMQLADGTPGSGWAEGVYENEYAYRDGAWRIRVLRWMPSFYGALPQEAIAAGRPSAPASPKFPPSGPPTYSKDETGSWILPFHYPHPHTGERTPIG